MKELSLHILDLVQNSIRSGADLIKIKVLNNTINNSLLVGVLDNGSGIEFKNINKVCNPFYTTRDIREVGLGISLFKMSAELTGGSFSINSKQKNFLYFSLVLPSGRLPYPAPSSRTRRLKK